MTFVSGLGDPGVAQDSQALRGHHDPLWTEFNSQDLHTQGVPRLGSLDRNRAHRAVHNGDVDVGALDGCVRDLAAVTVVRLDPEGLSVLNRILAGMLLH